MKKYNSLINLLIAVAVIIVFFIMGYTAVTADWTIDAESIIGSTELSEEDVYYDELMTELAINIYEKYN